MRILYYTSSYFLDCDLPLIKAFRHQGHEVYLIFELLPYALKSTIVNIKRQLPEVEILPLSAYEEFHLFGDFADEKKTFILNRPCKVFHWRNMKLRVKFSKLIREINPDIIHCTNFVDIPDLFLYQYRKKIIQIVHDPFPHSGEGNKRASVIRWISYKLSKQFVIFNESQRKDFSTRNHLDEKCVQVNILGTYDYLNYFKKEQTGISQNKKVLFWGRISPYKGVEYLLRAMEIVHQQIPNAELTIAGGGHLYFDFSPYKDKGYIKLINRYISMKELGELLSAASIVVCPYTDATQSGVIMSAYTYNVPVVATNVGGLPEMVEDGITGAIVPPKDAKTLADGIMQLLTSDEKLAAYRKAIYDYCHKGKFSWETIANKYISIYKTFLNTDKQIYS